MGFFGGNLRQESEECRARSYCTYVQYDLALHYPQNESMVAKCRIMVIEIYVNEQCSWTIDCVNCMVFFTVYKQCFDYIGAASAPVYSFPEFF